MGYKNDGLYNGKVIGMNSKRRCKWCKEYVDATKGIPLRVGFFCDDGCMMSFAIDKSDKQRQKKAKTERIASKKALKEKVLGESRPYQLKKAQEAFNGYIRERDREAPCISCNRHHTGQYHAGHYRSVGAIGALRFNQFNVNKQCSACNNHRSGNITEYRIQLVKKFGTEKVEWLESNHEPAKPSLDEIKAITVYYRKLLKRIKGD